MPDLYIEESCLSLAWGRALQIVASTGRKEAAPLVVSITGFDECRYFDENRKVRYSLDKLLQRKGVESVTTVANTIFPHSLWNPNATRDKLFERYVRIRPRILKASKQNSRGTYFDRIIANGPKGKENQLDFAIGTYLKLKNPRRSVLQVSVFDPKRDHSGAARLGFPCLQHVTFTPTEHGKSRGLNVNAFYATQYMVKRAYGNYVGLCHLGCFVAHELGIPLARVTCYAGLAMLDTNKGDIQPLLKTIKSALRRREK